MDYLPCMSKTEITLLNKYCPHEGYVLEFGAGGSTQFFLEHNVPHLITIESDSEWLQRLLQNPEISVRYKYNKWTPIHADINATKELGAPKSDQPEVSWLNYHQYVWDSIEEKNVTVVLIDGRFRVACVLQTLLHCTNKSLILMIHDFWNRDYYHCVLDFIDVIDRADTLGVFQPKKDIDWVKLSLLLQERQFDTR